MTERKLNPYVSKWTVQALARLFCTYAIVMGLAIVIGGDARFSSPSYVSAMQFPGAPESWGIVAAFLGAAGLFSSLAGRPRTVAWSMFAFSAWSLFIAFAFFDAALNNPHAGTTGIFAQGVVAVTCIVVGTAHYQAGD